MIREAELHSFAEKLVGLCAVSFVVYGSEARGDALPDSDIDVLAILPDYSQDVAKTISEIAFRASLEVGKKISVEIYSMDDFHFMVKEKFPFALGIYSAYKILFDNGFFREQMNILEDMEKRGEIKRYSHSRVWVAK
ncbi:MAG: nucleotidyltransferase domain-containing protein [Candidatus Freyarchaeota archaeon]|nr:nucleotidyltransferase domain-containing protein [Candidatus Jordarchaeia archaeon]